MKLHPFTKNTVRYLCWIFLGIYAPELSYAQSDNCASPTVINSVGTSCTNLTGQTLLGATQSSPNVTPGSCGGVAGADVWYSFVAQSTNPTITLSSIGASLRAAGTRVQILSGTCPSGFSVLACAGSTTTPLSVTGSGLTINQTYFIRVFTPTVTPAGTAASWGYNICITNSAPANDNCAGAITLTSSTSCSNTAGNLGPASNSAVTITAPDCAATFFNDIWYKFVAQTTNPTITLSGLTGLANPGIQLLDNNCGGTFTPLFCGTTSIAADYLLPGNTYYIRVYSTTSLTGSAGFNICITDPVASPPSNDDCSGAINLLISASCSNIPGTVSGSTYNASVPVGCAGGTPAYDVWYKFTALTSSSTITLSGAGANFNTPRLQLFSGTCSGLVSMACGTTTITNATVAGTTYYVRVYSLTGPAPNGNADFSICVAATGAFVRYGNSYVNITRKTTGGVVQNGDVLEIRMTINHTSGTMTKLRFVDNVPSKTTMATLAPHDSIRVITNEGLTFRKYTLASGDDAGTYKASPLPGEYNIRLNPAFGSSTAAVPTVQTNALGGAVGSMNAGSDKPKGGGGMLFAIAYRVVVTGVAGDTITLNPAQFIYNDGTSDITLTGTPFKIVISNPLTLCTNSIGVNIASEFGGTFGSGITPNRPTDLSIPISGYSFINNVNANNNVGDGRYGIVKNTSPKNSSLATARRRPNCGVAPALAVNDPNDCSNRMFGGFWYIGGDHTGTNNAAGNPPPAPGTVGGYMLEVNADFVASEIYRQNITNLCPNTYYEFSAWVKNICPTCGIDSSGSQFAGTPTAPTNGYVGVYPNLTFALNNVDYYNTGEIDTLGWQKKGFVFKTDSTQTTATFSIRNNSQGGGGNDWALDDIAVATCFPGMTYSPSNNPNICENNTITITDTVRSIFNNYVLYKWQRWSALTSGPWTDIPGASGTATPVLVGSTYQFVGSYVIPTTDATAANAGDQYRLVVASTSSNLSGTSCSYTDPTNITINILLNCGPPLLIDILSVNGNLTNNKAKITWVTSREDEKVKYSIERSDDGITFYSVGMVDSYFNTNAENNIYNFLDPQTVNDKVYYRIVVIKTSGDKKYSRTIQLNVDEKNKLRFGTVVNPFISSVSYEIISPTNGMAKIDLMDAFGKVVKTDAHQVFPGTNALYLTNTDGLATGVYVLRVTMNETTIYRKVMKEKK